MIELPDIGRALFGPVHWRAQLAQALDVDERTLRRWEKGAEIPSGVWYDCLRLINDHVRACVHVQRELRMRQALRLSTPAFTYTPLLRPASTYALPLGITWDYVEAPAMHGLANRPDLPTSTHRYGVIRTNRALTSEECDHFALRPL